MRLINRKKKSKLACEFPSIILSNGPGPGPIVVAHSLSFSSSSTTVEEGLRPLKSLFFALSASNNNNMGKKTKKPGKGKEKTERKTAKAEEKKARREGKKLSPEDDIDAILVFTLILYLHCFFSLVLFLTVKMVSLSSHRL